MKSLDNLTFILSKNKCNKSCPFCIAKSSNKLYNKSIIINDEFNRLEQILIKLESENIAFNRFVLSGNGEPSLYSPEQLAKIVYTIKKHGKMFKGFRIHTSGNIFFEKEKFNILNELPNIEYNIFRISFNNVEDKKILKYTGNYLDTDLFRLAKKVKCDVALTKKLNLSTFYNDLMTFTTNNHNIKTIRLKELLVPNNICKEREWILRNNLDVSQIDEIKSSIIFDKNNILNKIIGEKYYYNKKNIEIIYGESGNYKYYKDDLIIFNNHLLNYNEEVIY